MSKLISSTIMRKLTNYLVILCEKLTLNFENWLDCILDMQKTKVAIQSGADQANTYIGRMFEANRTNHKIEEALLSSKYSVVMLSTSTLISNLAFFSPAGVRLNWSQLLNNKWNALFSKGGRKIGPRSFMKNLLENLSITINLLLQHCLINLSEEKKNVPTGQKEVFL